MLLLLHLVTGGRAEAFPEQGLLPGAPLLVFIYISFCLTFKLAWNLALLALERIWLLLEKEVKKKLRKKREKHKTETKEEENEETFI